MSKFFKVALVLFQRVLESLDSDAEDDRDQDPALQDQDPPPIVGEHQVQAHDHPPIIEEHQAQAQAQDHPPIIEEHQVPPRRRRGRPRRIRTDDAYNFSAHIYGKGNRRLKHYTMVIITNHVYFVESPARDYAENQKVIEDVIREIKEKYDNKGAVADMWFDCEEKLKLHDCALVDSAITSVPTENYELVTWHNKKIYIVYKRDFEKLKELRQFAKRQLAN